MTMTITYENLIKTYQKTSKVEACGGTTAVEVGPLLAALHDLGLLSLTPAVIQDLLDNVKNRHDKKGDVAVTLSDLTEHLDVLSKLDDQQAKGSVAPRAAIQHCNPQLIRYLEHAFDLDEFSFLGANKTGGATHTAPEIVAALERQGFTEMLRAVVRKVAVNTTLTPVDFMAEMLAASDVQLDGAVGSRGVRALTAKVRQLDNMNQAVASRTLAFANALCLRHVSSGAGASLVIDAVLLFVDISGYSAVTAAIEHQGAHTVSAIVNGYIQKLVQVIHDHGGDVVKFAGDAILALWCEGTDHNNCASALVCAQELQSRQGTHPVRGTSLEFGLHCGISKGQCVSRIFSPRKLRNNDMPTHFHFLSGTPLCDVGTACDLAKRGQNAIHVNVLELVGAGFSFETVPTEEAEYVIVTGVEPPADWKPLPPPVKASKRHPSRISGNQNERLFIAPKVAAVLDSGMDQFFMAEMRELVVLFIHFAKTTDEEVWFDEVFHILESFGCDVVQIIDDDKGVHIVAALNLYAMAEHSVDAAINIALTMRAKHCDSHIGIAEGTAFCGVVGSPLACQWDITGPACVRAARLMQHAVKHELVVCFDTSIFNHAVDKSSLTSMGEISVKGSPGPVPIYTLRAPESNQRQSIANIDARVPALSFHQSLCPAAHAKIVREIRKLLRLPSASFGGGALALGGDSSPLRINSSSGSSGASGATTPSAINVRENSTTSSTTSLRSVKSILGNRGVTKVVVLTGCCMTGKFCAAVNALGEADVVPIVHQCYERQLLVQLAVVQTLSAWFSFSEVEPINAAANKVIRAFRERRQNEAFALGLALLEAVCQHSERKFCLVIRAGQFLDQSSVSFVGALAKRFEQCERLYCIVTCSPLYGYEEPEKKFVSVTNAQVLHVSTITDPEVQELFKHYVKQKADDKLLAFVCRKSSNYVECVVELACYLSKQALLTLSPDGFARMRQSAIDEVEGMLWGDISPTIRRKTIHVLDHLTPQLLTFCKIIASITEQPLISAFFYSVNKVCQEVQNASLDVSIVNFLDAQWLLKLCEHKCTAHSGTGELDAAVFLVPAMRDIVQSLLVPQQRVAINKICGDCYHETHPMNHPMQFLVRARHYLFAGIHDKYIADMAKGLGMLQTLKATLKDYLIIRGRYFDWIRGELTADDLDAIFGGDKGLAQDYESYCRSKRATDHSRVMSSAMQDLAILQMLHRLGNLKYPLELAPSRPAFTDVLKMIQLLVEMVSNGLSTQNALVLYEEEGATVDGILDQLSASFMSYITSLCFCLEGVVGKCTEYVHKAKEAISLFVQEEIDSENARSAVRLQAVNKGATGPVDSAAAIAAAKSIIINALTAMENHLTNHIEPLCRCLRSDSNGLMENAIKISTAVRRRVHFSKNCALASAIKILAEAKGSSHQGLIIVSLFENLSTILSVYCGTSHRLQKAFCEGLKEFYEGTLQAPETYHVLGEQVSVFVFCWLNCCSQQLLFH